MTKEKLFEQFKIGNPDDSSKSNFEDYLLVRTILKIDPKLSYEESLPVIDAAGQARGLAPLKDFEIEGAK